MRLKRRTIVLGGGAALVGSVVVWGLGTGRATSQPISKRSYDWDAGEFLSGGTAKLPSDLPAPIFRAQPQCVATAARTLGPCHVNDVAIREDVTDGVAGLPVRVSLRIVRANDCAPVANADVEIWHCNAAGAYSGRAANMCNAGDEVAKSAGFLRGRQISNADGQVHFLTVYPGWYRGRTVHIHFRILVDGNELLVSQLLFDDSLSDLIFRDHPDYAQRPDRDTNNGDDGIFSSADAQNYIFDTEMLEGGVLQASYTIGVAA